MTTAASKTAHATKIEPRRRKSADGESPAGAHVTPAMRQYLDQKAQVGDAILFSASLFANNSFEGNRRVIDISGDGPTNRGYPASLARDMVAKQGITINGLPILDGFYPDLHLFYLDHVIGGPGAFAIPAKGFKDFSAAVLNKLIREIAGIEAGNDLALGEARQR